MGRVIKSDSSFWKNKKDPVLNSNPEEGLNKLEIIKKNSQTNKKKIKKRDFPNKGEHFLDAETLATGGENLITKKSSSNFIEVLGYGNNYKGDHSKAGMGYHKAVATDIVKSDNTDIDWTDIDANTVDESSVKSRILNLTKKHTEKTIKNQYDFLSKSDKDQKTKWTDSGAQFVTESHSAVGIEGEERDNYVSFKKKDNKNDTKGNEKHNAAGITGEKTLSNPAEHIKGEVGDEIWDQIREDEFHKTDSPYNANLSEQEKHLIHFYSRNVLLDYDGPTYNFELQMLHDDDAISAQKEILAGKSSFSKWKPAIQPITVAETASTVLNIQGVTINAVGGPINNAHRVSGAVEFLITLAQPLGESLTTILVNSAVKMGMPDGLKATYLLKLHFIGRDPKTGEIIKPIPTTERQFLINIIAVDTSVDPSGAIYTLQCIRSGDQGKYDNAFSTDRPLQLNNIRTVQNLCDQVAEAININEIDKLAIEKSTLDEYYIHLSPGAKKFIGDDDIIATDDIKQSNAESKTAYTNKDLWDPHLRSFVIPQNTSLDRILEFGISHSKRMQKLAKGFNPDDTDADSNDSNKVENYIKYIFKLKCDIVNIQWDSFRNDYAREYHYTISLFPTIRPEILQGVFLEQPAVAEAKITALINHNFGNDRGETEDYKCMRKRYDYLFTGLNDKVLKFDIRYNNNFFMALHSYQNLFSGLEDTQQTAIKQSSAKLLEFKKQQKNVKEKWRSYLKTKSASIDPNVGGKVDHGLMQASKKSSLTSFEKEKSELIKQFIAAIDDGTIEADRNLITSLQNMNSYESKSLATHGGNKTVEDESGNKKQVYIQPRVTKEGIPVTTDTSSNPDFDREYAEKLSEANLITQIEGMEKPIQVMWGLTRSDSGKFNSEGHPGNKGKHQFDSVMNGALSDLSADMVQLDMEIRGDMFWLESEKDPGDDTASFFLGENYLLFTARTSAGEPSLQTGIATPGDSHKERLLNGVYAAVNITSRFEGGMFTQNIKGPRETFIYNTNTLESFEEE